MMKQALIIDLKLYLIIIDVIYAVYQELNKFDYIFNLFLDSDNNG